MVIGLGGAVIIAGFAVPFFVGITPSLVGVLIGFAAVFLAALFFGSFAVALSSFLKSTESFNVAINLLFVVFTFVSSSFYPVSAAPPLLQGFLLFNPLTHADDLLRLGMYGLAPSLVLYEGVALVVEAILAFGLAVFTFRRIKV